MRRILHADMDAFFAAVELLRHPELRGKPVIIGGRGDPTERGVASTASYEARKFGVRSGMPLRTAHAHCPDAVFLPVDFDHYAQVSQKIMSILHEFSPTVEEGGLDEAFVDVSQADQPAEEIARAIQERIRSETGLTCSIGIGPNKLLAKLASDLNKPDGLTVIGEDEIERQIWPLPVPTLWGVGPKTEARLDELGVHTIGELAALTLDSLVEHFGHAHGQYLYEAARGIDDSPVVPHSEPKSLGREVTFQHDVTGPATLQSALRNLTQDVVTRLRAGRHRATTVVVKVRFHDFETHTRQTTFADATDDLETINHAANRCLNGLPLVKPVRLIGVRLAGLETVHENHGGLEQETLGSWGSE